MYAFFVPRKNMKAMRHFHYENALHLAYNTVLAGEISFPVRLA
jgi:hypothetical protein